MNIKQFIEELQALPKVVQIHGEICDENKKVIKEIKVEHPAHVLLIAEKRRRV